MSHDLFPSFLAVWFCSNLTWQVSSKNHNLKPNQNKPKQTKEKPHKNMKLKLFLLLIPGLQSKPHESTDFFLQMNASKL